MSFERCASSSQQFAKLLKKLLGNDRRGAVLSCWACREVRRDPLRLPNLVVISPTPQKREPRGAVVFILLGRTPKNGAPMIRG